LKIGILETGIPPTSLVSRFGTYAAMMRSLLGGGYTFTTYDVAAGHLPERPEVCDAYVITGSAAGVYDDLPWLAPLTAFLRAAKGRVKLVGICFGHQIMAQAFGGRVVNSDKGWGLGLHVYTVSERASWMDEAESIAIAVSHQDQVVECPPQARVVAGSAFTPFGILAYDDGQAVSFQCHPEFGRDFASALIETRRTIFPDPAFVEAALGSLERPDDSGRVGAWIRRFLDRP
jgi:GMP synthase-like glutamine amidotransferase